MPAWSSIAFGPSGQPGAARQPVAPFQIGVSEALAEARGLRVSFVLAHQYLAQLTPKCKSLYIDADQDKQPVVAADHLTEHVEPLVHVARHRHALTNPQHRHNGTSTKIVETGHTAEATPAPAEEDLNVP